LIGSTISHYRVLERLGGGGMGVVYKAWDLSLERFAALKLLHALGDADDTLKRRFLREARIASMLDHPNICTVYEAGESADGRLFIAMTLCDGESLERALRRGPLPPAQALAVATQLADALGSAHGKGVFHRDLKPGNVMLAGGGRAVLVDFGIAWLSDQTRLTRVGDVMGTAAYLAPERLLGAAADARSDLWSLGVVLYEMVTGSRPFRDTDGSALMAAILERGFEPMSSLLPGVPPELERIVARSLAKPPADRYQGARELGADLRAAAAALAALPPAGPAGTGNTVTELDEATLRELPGAPLGAAGVARDDTAPHPGLPAVVHADSAPTADAMPVVRGGDGARGGGARGGGDGARGGGDRAFLRGGSAWVGRAVSHYRILEHLGGGGMGIVYRAEDTRLGRAVALKFLPPELTRDPEAKARFLQEARAASALDHPNICTIHEIGETADGQLFLAMACYRGATLKRRLAGGPLPFAEVVDLGLQICRGLAEAHRHGIVHRDVKPANLMVTGDGVVKILDFGIAKLAGAAAITRAGALLGTPGYMSPEQARGGEVDARTDLWSLGAVLYEMAAGRRPFPGDAPQAVLYSLFHDEPATLARLRPDTPPSLERVVARLLSKDPRHRYQSADEAAAALAPLSRPADGPPPEPPAPSAPVRAAEPSAVTPPPPPRLHGHQVVKPRRWLGAGGGAAAAALLAAALLGSAGYLLLRSRGGAAAVPAAGGGAPVRASFTQLTDLEGSESFPSLSPDGNFFLYTKTAQGKSDIFLQRVGGGNPIDLSRDSPRSDTQPAFSPDGQQIVFRSERDGGGIFLMGATGEAVRRLTDFGYNPAWSPDGSEILCATEGVSSPTMRELTSQLWRVDVATGAKRLVTAGDAVQPSWSPHGLRIAFWGLPPGSARRVLWTIPADRPGPVGSGEAAPLLDDAYVNWSPVWAPDGKYLYFASDRSGPMNLWRVPIAETTGRALGEPEPFATPSRSSGLASISRDGRRIIFATRDGKSNLERLAFDPATATVSGPGEALTQGSRLVRSCAASPDGRWIAFHTLVPEENLFVVHPDGSGLRQLTNGRAKDRNPRWSPDSSRLVFYSNRSGRYELWMVRADGGGLEQVTHTRGPSPFAPLWSPDGRKLACYLFGRGTALVDLMSPPAERGPLELPVAGGRPARFAATSWSPDGRRLAGWLEQPSGSPIPGIVLYSFQSASYSRLSERGTTPCWLHDSRRLLYRDEGKLSLLDTGSREVRPVLEPPANSAFYAMCTSVDDRLLYVVRETGEGHIWMLTLG